MFKIILTTIAILTVACTPHDQPEAETTPRNGPELAAPVEAAEFAELLTDCIPAGGDPIWLTYENLLPPADEAFVILEARFLIANDGSTCIKDRLYVLGAQAVGSTGGDGGDNGNDTGGTG